MIRRLALASLLAFGCGAEALAPEPDAPSDKDDLDGKEDASAEATLLDFEFDGELVTDYAYNADQVIKDQLLYTIGHLNGNRAVGRLDRVVLSDIQKTAEGERTRIRYKTRLPVAWGSKTNLPTSYQFLLPRDISYQGQEAFTSKYSHDCVDWGAHDVTSGSMWYYYRPKASRCSLAADVVKLNARVTVSSVNTTGKYPEYHKVWEDGVLDAVIIFGKYEDGATTASDAGIDAYDTFVGAIRSALARFDLTTTPENVPSAPGVGTPDITFEATLPGGKRVRVTALLVDNVRTAGPAFDARYEALSTGADLIMYNGHAGLGQNVRALARKGKFVAGKYVIVFMNGCDTFAYVDGSLAETRARLNPDDPTGTKYMEFVVNGMPSYFHSNSRAVMAMIEGLMAFDRPLTYEQTFARIDRAQVVLVTGEQDNVYFPGYPGGGGGVPAWTGIDETGALARGEERRFETPALPPGEYVVELSGERGDADLYVRTGSAPTTRTYDCRPYKSTSNERCVVSLNAAAPVHVMVRGYSATPSFRLVARPQ